MNTYSDWVAHLEQVLFDRMDMIPEEVSLKIYALEGENFSVRALWYNGVSPEEAVRYFV